MCVYILSTASRSLAKKRIGWKKKQASVPLRDSGYLHSFILPPKPRAAPKEKEKSNITFVYHITRFLKVLPAGVPFLLQNRVHHRTTAVDFR
jgi:hypothetical protein